MMPKTERILMTYERFAAAIESIPDDRAQMLYRTAAGARAFVASAHESNPRVTASQVNAGLEQGLRELPEIIQGVTLEWRVRVMHALKDAIALCYPEFMVLESERLKKVLVRGKIRSEAEFYRVRHEIDVVEGDQSRELELKRLYELVDAYEAVPKRRG